MKTNVVMKSCDRELFGSVIRQETKTSFLNLSDLQDAFDRLRFEKGWTNKHIPELISRRENLERIYYILEKQNVINVDLPTFIENVQKTGSAKHLKQLGQYRTTGARHTKTTWVNPYIWALIALELSPEFYANAVMWLSDSLILNRIEAGNFYKDLSKAISKFPNPDYVGIAKALNLIVFNKHEHALRDKASQAELKELETIEKQLAFAIDMGYINSQSDLIRAMRIMHGKKWGDACLTASN